MKKYLSLIIVVVSFVAYLIFISQSSKTKLSILPTPVSPTPYIPSNVPVSNVTSSPQLEIKIASYDPEKDPSGNCEANSFYTSVIPKTPAVLKASIDKLLSEFVAQDWKDYGARALNFKLQSAVINNGVANLKFTDPENFTSGGSCRVNTIYTRIEKTALQFPTVKKVVITGASFQP